MTAPARGEALSRAEEWVVSLLRDVHRRQRTTGSPPDPLELLERVRRWVGETTGSGEEARDPAGRSEPSEAGSTAVSPERSPHDPGRDYDEVRRRFVEHEARLRSEALVTDEILAQLARDGQGGPSQELLRVRAQSDSLAGAQFVLSNGLGSRLDLDLSATWSDPEVGEPAVVLEPRHVSLEPGAESRVRIYMDLRGSDIPPGTRLEGTVVARAAGVESHRLFLELEIYGASPDG